RGRRRCLVFSGVLLGACTVPLALWPVPAVAMAVRVVQGIGKGLLTVSATAVVADIVSRSRMNEGITLYGLGATFSLAIGPVIAMALIADGSYPRMFYVCAAACFLAAVCGAGITYENSRNR
ncbi:MAG: MFS transporter, partial [Bacteroidales bacterium]|nr:MFS transporter [Bacteroidales bacterium]